jgi:hypothetical protein
MRRPYLGESVIGDWLRAEIERQRDETLSAAPQ